VAADVPAGREQVSVGHLIGQPGSVRGIPVEMAEDTKKPDSPDSEKSEHDRAPYQKNEDRDPVKSAEETKEVPTQHGVLK
jgi:hypothetical protein